MTASRPDVRVSSAVGFTLSYEGVDRTLLSLSVENHSPVPVFIASVLVEMDDGRNLYPQFDAATHEPNSKRRLEPGQSFSFYIDLARIGGAAEPSQLRRALVKDEIGRSYVSDEETFRSHVSAIVGNS